MDSRINFSPEEIFTEHGSFIRTVISRNISCTWEGDDIYQNFFVSLVEKPLPKNHANIRGCIHKAILNDITDRHRKSVTYNKHLSWFQESLKNRKKYNDRPEIDLIAYEEAHKMLLAMEDKLGKNKTNAIRLRYIKSLPYRKIAKAMNIRDNSAQRYVSIGLRKFREYLGKRA